MKKITLLFFTILLVISCESNQEDPTEDVPCNFQGRTYVATSFLLDTTFDLDGDGIFSNDVLDEDVWCLETSISFDENDSVAPLVSRSLRPSVDFDANANPIQTFSCGVGDGANSTCFRNVNRITLIFNGNVTSTGIISENGNVLTFELSARRVFGFFEVITEDGNIVNYDGNVTIRYELQQ